MVIDVSSVLKESGGEISLDCEINLPDTEFNGSTYHFCEPVKVSGRITNNGTTLILRAECDGVLSTQCVRCLKDIDVPVHFNVTETLMKGEKVSEEYEDVIVFEGTTISLDEIIENNFIMNISAQYLCSEDCKGLCPKCGADLNEGGCNCTDDEIDPRWAALKEIMDNGD